jgi:crossover junction endodeoxyribonuclease RuvC
MLVIGIDSGLEGAVAAIDDLSRVVSLQDTPIVNVTKNGRRRREYAEPAMAALIEGILKSAGSSKIWVALENVHSMPKQGVASSFNFGVGFGVWRGILAALRTPYERIEPTVWKRAFGLKSGKGAAVARALRMFPKAEIGHKYGGRTIYSDGRAEALLIAEYARRLWSSPQVNPGGKTLERIFAEEKKRLKTS